MRKDFFSIFSLISTIIFAALAVFWVAGIALAAVALIFGIGSAVTSRVFNWPVKNVALPIANRLHIGKTRPGALIGILLTALCVALCIGIIRDFQAPAIRRIGQGIAMATNRLGRVGDKLEAIAGEGVGYQRLERWSDWLWAEDMQQDDTFLLLNQEGRRLPAYLFNASQSINQYGRELEAKVFEGERHAWFLWVYWFVTAVLIPFCLTAFIVTLFQICSRRLNFRPWFVSLCTLFLLYFLFSAFYLLPYVSHPYHTVGVPFWVAVILYFVAGFICSGIVRANQAALYDEQATVP